jgi:hypothetical protein
MMAVRVVPLAGMLVALVSLAACAEQRGEDAGGCDPGGCAASCGSLGGTCVGDRCVCGADADADGDADAARDDRGAEDADVSPEAEPEAEAEADAPRDEYRAEDARRDDAADDGPREEATCVPTAATDTTCDRVDDDCDRRTDEDYAGWPCGTGECLRLSECALGEERCREGTPADEECNGLDDDCDGATDEHFECVPGGRQDCATTCGTTGTQVCAESTCSWGECLPPPDACNGVDDDCNGECDDVYSCCRDATVECTTLCGSSGSGTCTASCGLPVVAACTPPAEACNGLDDDCDTLTDEVGDGAACGDACCNGAETACVCPEDCGVAPPLAGPLPLAPANGALTGSPHAPESFAFLRPRFRWTAAVGGCGGATYEIQVDDSCATPGFASCAFPSPEAAATDVAATEWRPADPLAVSTAPPVGRRYYWRVRACEGGLVGCSDWSAVRYVDVGRAAGDFDGDGYGDAAVGAYQVDAGATNEGNVYVYPGGAGGLGTTPARVLDDPANDSYAHFGYAVALAGDVNADGYADLIVGAEQQTAGSSNEGNAFVYLGSALGLPPAPAATLDNPAGTSSGSFGCSVAAAGDVDADGFADVVVGASANETPETDEGNAFVFLGSALGVVTTPATSIDNPADQDYGHFGWAVGSPGDIDGDGYADVVVGARDQDAPESGEGNAFVFYGSAAGIAATPSLAIDNPADDTTAYFGAAVGGGDFDADGYADLAVGAPYHSAGASSEGNVFLFRGSAAGVSDTPWATIDNPANQSGGHFGAAVCAGDVNGDGFADLVASAPDQNAPETDEGNAFLFVGGAGGLGLGPAVTVDNPADQASADFGTSVSCGGDFDADGYADALVGAYQMDAGGLTNAGQAFVFPGSAAGIPDAPAETLDCPAAQSSAYFGFSVARMWGVPACFAAPGGAGRSDA